MVIIYPAGYNFRTLVTLLKSTQIYFIVDLKFYVVNTVGYLREKIWHGA